MQELLQKLNYISKQWKTTLQVNFLEQALTTCYVLLTMLMFRSTRIRGGLKGIMEGILLLLLMWIVGHLNTINFGHMMDLPYCILQVMMAILD